VHRSRAKTFLERVRRQFSMKRLFRCNACGWRGWGIETARAVTAPEMRAADSPPPDLDAIDVALTHASAKPDSDAKA
jgi:hypothetical protein